MKSLGLRAEKDGFHWALVEGSQTAPVLISDGKCSAPKTYDEPKSLRWYRERIRTIIDEFKPSVVAIRFPETYMKFKPELPSSLYARIRIDGVIVEASQSSGVSILTGAWKSISSRLGSGRAKETLLNRSSSGYLAFSWRSTTVRQLPSTTVPSGRTTGSSNKPPFW